MPATAGPEVAGRADALLEALLRSGPLAGTGRRRDDGTFVRRSCCLFYRVPGAGTCGDCVLDDRP
jgi:ferric iron reductase protein FhuF